MLISKRVLWAVFFLVIGNGAAFIFSIVKSSTTEEFAIGLGFSSIVATVLAVIVYIREPFS